MTHRNKCVYVWRWIKERRKIVIVHWWGRMASCDDIRHDWKSIVASSYKLDFYRWFSIVIVICVSFFFLLSCVFINNRRKKRHLVAVSGLDYFLFWLTVGNRFMKFIVFGLLIVSFVDQWALLKLIDRFKFFDLCWGNKILCGLSLK